VDQQQLWVEPVGSIIMARVRGVPNEAVLRECQERVLMLVRDTGQNKVLYDALEMDATVDQAIIQQKMDAEMGDVKLRRAIVVPNTRIAYLARLAFGEGEHRVFYNDIGAALTWLQG
jgi:ribosomal protein L1